MNAISEISIAIQTVCFPKLSLKCIFICNNKIFVETFVNSPYNKKVAETALTSQIITLLDHYKQNDPLGIPGAPVPDPFPVPYTKQS